MTFKFIVNKAVLDYVKDCEPSVENVWELKAIRLDRWKSVRFHVNPASCSEIDIQTYGEQLTDEQYKFLLGMFDLFPEGGKYIRVTTRIKSTEPKIKTPKGLRKIGVAKSRYSYNPAYIHFFHKILSK